MGNIRLYGSTSGYTELAPPAVAPDGVLSLPSGTGTLALAADNKVLQVVRATDTTQRSTTSTSFVDVTGMSITITPTKSDSAILVFSSFLAQNPSSSAIRLAITDSSNNALSGSSEANLSLASGAGATSLFIIGYSTPASVLPVTYKLRFRSANGDTAFVLNSIQTGQMYAIEVSA